MREIKFRAWNPITEEMAYSNTWIDMDEGLLHGGELSSCKIIARTKGIQ